METNVAICVLVSSTLHFFLPTRSYYYESYPINELAFNDFVIESESGLYMYKLPMYSMKFSLWMYRRDILHSIEKLSINT